ncbi:hypothetical protein RCC89_17125 [Cytophagaceae bacterium ABcell3]|nr:hypothetical protein RCC89_17125 [Cytophagaceae bacterium ABcell3]
MKIHYPDFLCATLVADGGSENHAVTVSQLLETTPDPKITKVVALKDIAFSNSPVEAVNKVMKRYLRYYDPDSVTGFLNAFLLRWRIIVLSDLMVLLVAVRLWKLILMFFQIWILLRKQDRLGR